MLYPNSRFDLSPLVRSISSIAAQAEEEFALQRIAHELARHWPDSRVELAVLAGGGRRTIESGDVRSGGPRVRFDRPLDARSRTYGHLLLERPQGEEPLSETQLALETVAQQLALLAERLHLRLVNEGLARQVRECRTLLLQDKLMARASGVVAAIRGISLNRAAQWIHAEAARTARAPLQVADRIVLNRQGRLTELIGRSRPALRKTA